MSSSPVRSLWPILMASLTLVACKSSDGEKPVVSQPKTAPNSPEAKAVPVAPAHDQILLGDTAAKRLSFVITKIYRDQVQKDSAPWHASGGDWTYFDGKTQGGAVFTIGIPPAHAEFGGPMGFDKTELAVPDRADGARLVDEFGAAFTVSPPPKGAEKALHSMDLPTVTVTTNAMRTAKGDFGGVGGGWTATKWFVGTDDDSPEVYFNYNLVTKQGEFTEKDPDSDAAIAAALARSLRDGFDGTKSGAGAK